MIPSLWCRHQSGSKLGQSICAAENVERKDYNWDICKVTRGDHTEHPCITLKYNVTGFVSLLLPVFSHYCQLWTTLYSIRSNIMEWLQIMKGQWKKWYWPSFTFGISENLINTLPSAHAEMRDCSPMRCWRAPHFCVFLHYVQHTRFRAGLTRWSLQGHRQLRGLSPHANYTDRAAAAGRRS